MRSESKKIAPVYLFMDNELLLESPVEAAWPHVLNYPSWQNYSSVRTVSGGRGREGEVVALIKEEKGFVFPPYYARTLKLEPPYRVVWKTFVDPGTHPIDRFGIIDFRLHRDGNNTRFCSHLLYEFLVPYEHESELEAFRQQQLNNFETLQALTRPKLKQLVEKRA